MKNTVGAYLVQIFQNLHTKRHYDLLQHYEKSCLEVILYLEHFHSSFKIVAWKIDDRKKNRSNNCVWLLYFLNFLFLSTGGTSTGAPVCLSVRDFFSKKRFRDYLTLRYFLHVSCLVIVIVILVFSRIRVEASLAPDKNIKQKLLSWNFAPSVPLSNTFLANSGPPQWIGVLRPHQTIRLDAWRRQTPMYFCDPVAWRFL